MDVVLFMTTLFIMLDITIGSANIARRNCSFEEVDEASLQSSQCYDRSFRELYLVVNGLLVRSGPQSQSRSIVSKAAQLSRSQNLSLIQLKVLTDVIHYHVEKKPLLRSSGEDEVAKRRDNNDIIALGSDVLDQRNMDNLQKLRKHYPVGERLLIDFEKYATKTVSNIKDEQYISVAKNLEFQASVCPEGKDYIFMPSSKTDIWNQTSSKSSDSITISKEAVRMNGTNCLISSFYYNTLQHILPTTNSLFSNENNTNRTTFINSPIISLSLFGRENGKLRKPVRIKLKHSKAGPFKSRGVFWNFSDGYNGYWSDAGCKVDEQTQEWTIFKCNHLTNFAILVTGKIKPGDSSSQHYDVLSIISSTGCFLSMIGEISTLAVYAATRIRSTRRVILINTVLCLVLAQVIFLAGVEQAKKVPALCILVAASICYFFLAAFVWMLNMGIHLHIITSKVFSTRLPFRYFILSAYVLPLVEIVLAAAITQGRGFGSHEFCWLTATSGAIWIFLGPVTVIVLVNICITVLVLIRMFHTKKIHDAKSKEKVKHLFRAVIVLTPSLGLTWILGIFTMASDDIAMHFVFAIFNSLQGIFIFINCCLLDKKIRAELIGLIRHPSRLSMRGSSLNRIKPAESRCSQMKYEKYGTN